MTVAVPSSASRRPCVEPPPLRPGAHVALVSPSGPLNGPHELERALDTAQSLGWTTWVGPHALARDGYFAGADTQRAADLITALTDPRIDGIWCLRGGYGAARLLPALWPVLEQAPPKALMGYSDITALHAAWQRAGVVSYHAPTARSPLSVYSREHLTAVVQHASPVVGTAPEATVLRGGRAHGRLVGGNLALVASLCGTPWACDFQDAIVVLEDINEATYRLDRMLTQLRQSGAFDGCVGLALGHFTDCVDTTEDGTRALVDIAQELADALHVPALLGVPIGHIADQWTVPLGAYAQLDADARTLTMRSDLITSNSHH
jgi:muramoyltetrapeptide carboxypeptidase